MTAIWTGGLAAVLAVFLRRLTMTEPSEDALFSRARNDLGESLWVQIAQRSAIHSCDADLIRSIVLAEVLQRPRWTRRLEAWKGLVFGRGTYGVAQMGSRKPLDDNQSIELLCQSFAGYRPPRSEDSIILDERLRARIERHNPSASFTENVLTFYYRLAEYHLYGTEAMADDLRPVIEIRIVRRRGQRWEIGGTAVVFEGNVTYSAHSQGRPFLRGSTQADLGAPSRGEWSLSVPLRADSVVFSEEPMDEDELSAQQGRDVSIELN